MGHGAGATFFETSETTQREKAEGTTDVTFGGDVGNELLKFDLWPFLWQKNPRSVQVLCLFSRMLFQK